MFDLIIHNARMCDGTGQASFMGSLGVKDGRITHLGQASGLAAQRTIDVAGLVAFTPLRHYVMGEASFERQATEAEIVTICNVPCRK